MCNEKCLWRKWLHLLSGVKIDSGRHLLARMQLDTRVSFCSIVYNFIFLDAQINTRSSTFTNKGRCTRSTRRLNRTGCRIVLEHTYFDVNMATNRNRCRISYWMACQMFIAEFVVKGSPIHVQTLKVRVSRRVAFAVVWRWMSGLLRASWECAKAASQFLKGWIVTMSEKIPVPEVKYKQVRTCDWILIL